MPTAPCHALPRSTRRRLGATISALMLVAGCTAPTPTPPSIPGGPEPAPRPPQTGVTAPEPGAPALAPRPVQAPPSLARTPREFRRDAAAHLYQVNADRIYKGKLPPLLYAIGVLEVHIDERGGVERLHWLRAPRHAPEVIKEIERTARAAAPYPRASRLGRVVYTDTWLWDKSGSFQLDTLTEGQL